MQRFIVEGYLTLQSELPRTYHARMYEALEPLDETGPRGHNNLLPCVPELRRMLDEPRVVGALTSVLGPDYYLHFHRHDHVNYPDAAQPLHKDGDNHSHNAVDGLQYVKAADVIVCDYAMSPMNGEDFADQVNLLGYDTPIILFTGQAIDCSSLIGKFHAVLKKPTPSCALALAVLSTLQQHPRHQ